MECINIHTKINSTIIHYNSYLITQSETDTHWNTNTLAFTASSQHARIHTHLHAPTHTHTRTHARMNACPPHPPTHTHTQADCVPLCPWIASVDSTTPTSPPSTDSAHPDFLDLFIYDLVPKGVRSGGLSLTVSKICFKSVVVGYHWLSVKSVSHTLSCCCFVCVCS